MKKTKKFLALFFIVILAVLFACPFMASKKSAIAYASGDDEEVSPYGLYTTISLKIDGENGNIIATAKNDFTLFSSKVEVYIYLYSCYTYRDSYSEMVLVQQDYISDLNMGKSITVSASTKGEQKYWQARMRYKVDKKNWAEKHTDTFYYKADGTLVD